MKKITAILLAATLVSIGYWFGAVRTAHAQTTNNGGVVLLIVGPPSSCAWSGGATWTNAMMLCATNAGLYYSLNGSATFNPVAAAGGVASFNGRTGAVVSASGDYSYSQLTGMTHLQEVTAGTFSLTGASITP